MKRIELLGIALGVILACVSCKSKQSAYKAAYELAKEKETVDADPWEEPRAGTQEEEFVAPVFKSKAPIVPRPERITPVDADDALGIKLYSVVIGSFRNKTNAGSLKERMEGEGYKPIVAENEQGMFRVILTSHENRRDAEQSREAVRSKYYPNFQDAWLLERQY